MIEVRWHEGAAPAASVDQVTGTIPTSTCGRAGTEVSARFMDEVVGRGAGLEHQSASVSRVGSGARPICQRTAVELRARERRRSPRDMLDSCNACLGGCNESRCPKGVVKLTHSVEMAPI